MTKSHFGDRLSFCASKDVEEILTSWYLDPPPVYLTDVARGQLVIARIISCTTTPPRRTTPRMMMSTILIAQFFYLESLIIP